DERARLAFALGEPDWPSLYARLRLHRALVEAEFERVAWDAEGAGGRPDDPVVSAWEAGDIAAMLEGTPLAADEVTQNLLNDLRHGGLYQRMETVARQRLAAVMGRT